MKQAKITPPTQETTFAPLPRWAEPANGQTPEAMAFAAGASLCVLHGLVTDQSGAVPVALLRNRLALLASEAALRIEGRAETTAAIRDAVYLTRPGDGMGPAGEMYLRWRRSAALPLRSRNWINQLGETLPTPFAEALPHWMKLTEATGSPAAQAASLIGLILEADPREEATAMICADAVLARGLGWSTPLPLCALYMTRAVLRDLRQPDFHLLLNRSAKAAIGMAHDLSRRAAVLRKIAPKLRSKGSDHAVALFLQEDAVSPSTMLSPVIKGTNTAMTDRSARRLCDRLVSLGAAKELTGRGSFRLYGLA
ncbi:DUF1403 family protein [Neptunicoccus cionae]|uniref:DUF1403 domain-containing protein n=1 Tax=Neptunicoccus cionae TaxID=2035344 RepID=A0A916VS57_9RHOB|nr:DUF1403 family protein [Amylibacter cionae]GGA27042.1 hypothetical protein GCM10011498_30040 [Amylibacter cionae]